MTQDERVDRQFPYDGSKVLVVGAGGIGCEVLKNLALMVRPHDESLLQVHVVDMDTIDVSNLNRQFLFQKQHVGKYKSTIAADSIRMYRPTTNIVAHQGDIRDKSRFSLDWFASFDLIFSALDNIDARRYVNHVCSLIKSQGPSQSQSQSQSLQGGSHAKAPILIESGTEGYQGQVSVIQRGLFECFDCIERPVLRMTYPVCTIRSTPSALIHCIVWAKDYLFFNIFCEESLCLNDNTTDIALTGLEEPGEKPSASSDHYFARLRHQLEDLLRSSKPKENSPEVYNNLFLDLIQFLYIDSIAALISMPDLWQARKKPTVLPFTRDDLIKLTLEATNTIVDTNTLSRENYLRAMWLSFEKLMKVFLQSSYEDLPLFSFDKDDDNMMIFISSAANLRASLFDIPQESDFKIKAMAGNIIPAIATTNSMVAGCMVLEGLKILSQRVDQCRAVYYTPSRQFSTMRLNAPNPSCTVCNATVKYLYFSSCTQGVLRLSDLVSLCFTPERGEGSIVEKGRTLYDPELTLNLSKSLSELNIFHDDLIFVYFDNDGDASDGSPLRSLDPWRIVLKDTDICQSPPVKSFTKFQLVDIFDGILVKPLIHASCQLEEPSEQPVESSSSSPSSFLHKKRKLAVLSVELPTENNSDDLVVALPSDDDDLQVVTC